jgi:hypothetical protein
VPGHGVRSNRYDRPSRAGRLELLALAAVVALAAFLRLHALDIAEFKLDEATAVDRARQLLDGAWPTVGLTSSVGALNPPFFIYLIAVPLAVRDDPLAATAFIGVLAVTAVALTYVVLRPRFGSLVALTTAAYFATAPWAVLYGRKIWAQDALPIVDVLLLWCLLLALERQRSRAVLFVPVLFCLAFQLNFSAVALLVPVSVVLAYRIREVDWMWFLAGFGCASLLLAPWLAHEATHGFTDVGRLLSEGRGNRGSAPLGAGTVEAMRQTIDLLGAWNWEYVVGQSRSGLVADAGWAWTWGRWASALTAALLVAGSLTCAFRIAFGAARRRGWPWVDLDVVALRRALLLVWLLGIWLSYATSATDQIYPHYLIVTYPVSFAVAALAVADVLGLLRGRARISLVPAALTAAAVAGGYAAFTLAFFHFVEEKGGVSGDYGVAYKHEAALARIMKRRGLRVAQQPALELLVTGTTQEPAESARLVRVRDALVDPTPLACAGERRSFGPLIACLPSVSR